MEQHEPRFVGTLNEVDGRIEGLQFLSPTEIELTLYLNQMGVFNLVDDGTLPGCAALKLRIVSNNTQKWSENGPISTINGAVKRQRPSGTLKNTV